MASKTIKGLTVEIDGKVDGLGKALNTVERQSRSLSKELTDINKLLKFDPSNVEGLTQKKKNLTKAIEACAEKLRILEQAEEQVTAQFERGEVAEEHLNALKREIELTSAKMRGFEQQLDGTNTALNRLEGRTDDAARDVDDLGDEADESAREIDDLGDESKQADSKISGLQSASKKAGDGFTTLKGVIANLISEALEELVELLKEAGKYMLQTGMDFEAGMSRVAAISGATGEDLDRLTEKAMEMGAKTKFSAGESAEAFGYLAQAGWDTEMMIDGIDGVMNLAAADGLDLASASTIVADSLSALGYEAKDASKFADVLAQAAAASNTNVSMMGESFKYVGPLAGALGYEMEDVGTALAIMANSGIKAEQAGTSLRSLLTNMSKPSDACAAAMEKYGISLVDADGNAKSLERVLYELRTTFHGLSESEKIALASTLANKTGMSGLLAIVNASDEEFSQMGIALNEASGAAEDMATTMQDNLAGDVEKLGGAFDTLAIKLTDSFNKPMRDGVQAITAFLDGEATMTETLSSLGGAFTEAFGTFQTYLPQLLQMGGELITYLVNGLVTGLPTFLAQANQMVADFCSTIAEAAPNLVSIAGSLLTSFVQGIFDFIPILITGAAEIVGSLATGITENAANFVSTALTLLDGFADKLTVALPQLINSGMEFIKNLVTGLMQALPEFIARAPEIISKFANLINDNFPTILQKGIGIIWELIKGIIAAIPTLVQNIPKIFQAFMDVWEAFGWLDLGRKALQAVGNGIMAVWGWIKGVCSNTLNTIVNAIRGLPQALLNLGKQALQWMGNGIKSMWSSISSVSTNVLTTIINAIKSLPQLLLNLGRNAITWLVNGIRSLTSFLWNTVKSVGNGIVNALITLPSKLINIGKNLITGLWNGISSAVGWLWGRVTDLGNSVVGWFKNLFGIHSPSTVFAEIGKYLDEGLAEGLIDNMDDPLKAAQEVASNVIDEAQDMDGLSLERSLQQRAMKSAVSVTTVADEAMLTKLDQVLTAIQKGQVLTIDSKKLIGATVAGYDNALGQRRVLAAHGAI